MKWHSASSARQFRSLDQTLTLDQVAEFWRTRRVKEGTGSFSSASAAFGPAGPIHLGHPGLCLLVSSFMNRHLPDSSDFEARIDLLSVFGKGNWVHRVHDSIRTSHLAAPRRET